MNGLLNHSKLFLKRNASTILTYVGGAGVIATGVMAAKATPKATILLKKAEEEKGEALSKWEVVQVAGPAYIPTILVGASTIACIFGANVLNKRHQAALMSVYALLDSSYKDYKDKVKELYGEDADGRVREELAKDKYDEEQVEVEDNKLLFYDEYSEQYFNATMEDVLRAEYLLNRDLSYHGYACLNELYALLRLPTTDYGEILGWYAGMVYDMQWYAWIEFNHRKVELEDGMECYILEILTEPVPEFDDY
jgi:hypothetical protein